MVDGAAHQLLRVLEGLTHATQARFHRRIVGARLHRLAVDGELRQVELREDLWQRTVAEVALVQHANRHLARGAPLAQRMPVAQLLALSRSMRRYSKGGIGRC
jgi:hypothetical protein